MTKNTDAEMIMKHARENNVTGYRITTVYTKAETATIATKYLKHALPYLFDDLIGNDWRRKNVSDAFALFAFLAEPVSRRRQLNDLVPIGSDQDTFHHHSILLVEPWIADRISVNFPWITSSDLPFIAPSAFARIHLAETQVRSCEIQQLPTYDDIQRTTEDAAKAVSRMSELYPYEYMLIAPLCPSGSAGSPRSSALSAFACGSKDQPYAPKKLSHYEPELRGPAQNRWGGQETQRLRTYGGKFGAANDGRSLSADEIERWTRENGL
jgi:hypothetical protein